MDVAQPFRAAGSRWQASRPALREAAFALRDNALDRPQRGIHPPVCVVPLVHQGHRPRAEASSRRCRAPEHRTPHPPLARAQCRRRPESLRRTPRPRLPSPYRPRIRTRQPGFAARAPIATRRRPDGHGRPAHAVRRRSQNVSRRLNATPSISARTMWPRPWFAASPTSAARAFGSQCGVRSPIRYGAQSTPSAPGGTLRRFGGQLPRRTRRRSRPTPPDRGTSAGKGPRPA